MKQKKLKQKASKTYHDPGVAIRGERVTAQDRKIRQSELIHGTSTHRINQAKLEGSVFCVIDRPLNYLVKK